MLCLRRRTQELGKAGNLKRMTMKKVDTRTPPPEDLTGEASVILKLASGLEPI